MKDLALCQMTCSWSSSKDMYTVGGTDRKLGSSIVSEKGLQ